MRWSPQLKRMRRVMPTASTSTSIQTEQLNLFLGGRTVLSEINLSLSDEGITMIMGPNGAGKSVLLRCLHGLFQPSKGQIRIFGEDRTETRTPEAMVFQTPVLLRRSLIDNLQFAAPAATAAEIHRCLESVHLTDKAQTPARQLSGGEQQRLAVVRALLTQPRLLFLDEPTASLDPFSVKVIEDLVQQASNRGVKVLFISHDIGQSRRLASDVVFIHSGQVTEHQPADQFFTHTKSTPAQQYLAGQLVL